MIEILILVRDTETRLSEQHFTDVDIDAEQLHTADHASTDRVWHEIRNETRTAVTAAIRRLADKAALAHHTHVEWKTTP